MKYKRDYVIRAIFLTGLIFFVVLICLTNLFHFNYKMNADIGAEVILTRLIWESKQIVPNSWYVGNEAKIICTPNLAVLFYGFTKNMILSSGAACSTMTILILLSILYFGKAVKWSLTEIMLYGFLCLMLPCNFMIIEVMYLFGSYYAIHIVILFITLGIYIKNINSASEKLGQVWLMVCCILFALLLGMQGTRGILVIYGPLFGMEIIRILYRLYCGGKPGRKDICISSWATLMLVCSYVGTLFKIASAQEMSRNLRKGFYKLWTTVIPEIANAIGFSSTNKVGKACLCIMLVLAFGLLADILRKMLRKDKLKSEEWVFLVLFSSPVVTALLIAFTTVVSSPRYYFLFIYVMAFAGVLAVKRLPKLKLGIGFVFFVFMLVNINRIYIPILESEEPPQNAEYEVSKYLEANNFNVAYATFENANTITVLGGGAVQVAAVASVERMDVCKSLSSTQWYVPNVPYESRTAYVITEMENESFQKFYNVHQEDIQFDTQIGKFLIYISDYNFSCLE